MIKKGEKAPNFKLKDQEKEIRSETKCNKSNFSESMRKMQESEYPYIKTYFKAYN